MKVSRTGASRPFSCRDSSWLDSGRGYGLLSNSSENLIEVGEERTLAPALAPAPASLSLINLLRPQSQTPVTVFVVPQHPLKIRPLRPWFGKGGSVKSRSLKFLSRKSEEQGRLTCGEQMKRAEPGSTGFGWMK